MKEGIRQGRSGDVTKDKAGDEEPKSELHLWVALLIRYLEEVDVVPQGSFL